MHPHTVFQTMHILIPFAAATSPDTDKWVQTVRLPNLNRLLATMVVSHSDVETAESYSPPHERALARLQGLPTTDGCIPWAAERAICLGLPNAQSTAWSFITLCHAQVTMNDVQLQNPELLQVTEAESETLLSDMQPYFAEDGLALHALTDLPNTWLVSGEPLRGMHTASLDRVIGKNIDAWQAKGEHSSKIHRLQNEMQMLLYTHKVNIARDRSKQLNINSIWFHGSGENCQTNPNEKNSMLQVLMLRNLANAAFDQDWHAWATAWQELDATVGADLLTRANNGEPVSLTLCGEHTALRYETKPASALARTIDKVKSFLDLKPSYLLPKVLFNL